MDESTVNRNELLGRLPPSPNIDHTELLRKLIHQSGRKVIVLDDDPTGTQTVHDIPVVTRWTVAHLARELTDPAPASYVLTNSRSLPTGESAALNRAIAENLREARVQTGRDFTLVSRSDSTLRSHFPEELDALTAGLREQFDAWVICPFFEEGGRLTVNDLHYVAEGDRLVPAAQTPFAADRAFGYKNSNLRRWVIEKTAGRVPLERIASLSLEDLRSADTTAVHKKLRSLTAGSECIVNSVVQADLEAAVAALLAAEAEGKRFLYRTAASFVAVRSGIQRRPLLTPAETAAEAYNRTLEFEDVSKERAAAVFGRKRKELNDREVKCFEDFIMWRLVELSAKHDLPFQIHTGQARIQGFNPMLLVDLIEANPKTKFVLFHGGFPWVGETGVIGQRFRNVWIDSCWLPTLSYTMAKRAFQEWLEAVPSNRIMWGSDTGTAEGIYGATEFTRQCLAEALAEKVVRGELREEHAIQIGRQVMRENALELFPTLKKRLWRK